MLSYTLAVTYVVNVTTLSVGQFYLFKSCSSSKFPKIQPFVLHGNLEPKHSNYNTFSRRELLGSPGIKTDTPVCCRHGYKHHQTDD